MASTPISTYTSRSAATAIHKRVNSLSPQSNSSSSTSAGSDGKLHSSTTAAKASYRQAPPPALNLFASMPLPYSQQAKIPTSPAIGAASTSVAHRSSRLRYVLLIPFAYVIFLIVAHFPQYQQQMSLPPLPLPFTKSTSRSRPEGTYPLPNQQPPGHAKVQHGTVIRLSPDFYRENLEPLLCQVFSVYVADDTKASSPYKSIASRHITVAVTSAPGLPSTATKKAIERAGAVTRSISSHPNCVHLENQPPKSSSRLPSLSVVDVNSRDWDSWLEAVDPVVVLDARRGNNKNPLKETMQGNATLISLPEPDLAHSAWIFALPEQSIRAWHTPTFKVIAITNDRAVSLRRLYESLQTAHYFGDQAELQVKIEATANEATLESVLKWTNDSSPEYWRHGPTNVMFRFRQAGLITNIVEAWWPTNDHEYAFFFEDDIEASPFYFAWAKWAILMYRYGPDAKSEIARNLYGVSLIQQRTSELDRATGRIMWNAPDQLKDTKHDRFSPYLSQVPSSWGAVFFPQPWREFHDFIQIRDTEDVIPKKKTMIEPSVVSDNWSGSWKRYLIELVFLRGYTMLYPNYPDFMSLSTNHVELGEHINPAKQAQLKALQEVPLMQEDDLITVPGRRMPRAAALPVFDLWGALASSPAAVAKRGRLHHQKLWGCAKAMLGATDYDGFNLFAC